MTIGSRARFDCTNILFIVAEVIFALVFVRRFTSVIYDMWQAPPPREKQTQSIEIKFEKLTTILNFDTLVLSLYYHQYKFNDSTQELSPNNYA